MKLTDKIKILAHIIHWRINWSRRDLDHQPDGLDSERFISARQAAALIPEGACVVSSGFAGSARCSVFFWAIRESFQKSGHPRNLTWVNVGAQGSRGRVPGTVEELGLPGLLKRYITGHHETAKAQLKLAEAGQLELHTLPQGVMTMLFEAQANGETHCDSEVGLETFMDPRVGNGSQVTPNASMQLVKAKKNCLNYTMPQINVALFNAPYADREGNIYFKHAACLSENISTARAARANGGRVIATVSGLIPKEEAAISLKAGEVDYIVVHPYNEQIASVPQKSYWRMFTPESTIDPHRANDQLSFVNRILKITPVRNEVDRAIARLAAQVFVELVPKGALCNIGVGYPEEVTRCLFDEGMDEELIFTTEAGVYGGRPLPGVFFGAAIRPKQMISSLEMFKLYKQGLGATVLGFLQVDSQGNVNASRRGPKITDYVGPGGFPDIVDGARTVIFIGSWMARARFQMKGGQIKIIRPGKLKFVSEVDEITFAASEGLRKGKQVYYVTHVGVFKLTAAGPLLIKVMPGIDVQRDVIDATGGCLKVAEADQLSVVDPSVVSGKGFSLAWKETKELLV